MEIPILTVPKPSLCLSLFSLPMTARFLYLFSSLSHSLSLSISFSLIPSVCLYPSSLPCTLYLFPSFFLYPSTCLYFVFVGLCLSLSTSRSIFTFSLSSLSVPHLRCPICIMVRRDKGLILSQAYTPKAKQLKINNYIIISIIFF